LSGLSTENCPGFYPGIPGLSLHGCSRPCMWRGLLCRLLLICCGVLFFLNNCITFFRYVTKLYVYLQPVSGVCNFCYLIFTSSLISVAIIIMTNSRKKSENRYGRFYGIFFDVKIWRYIPSRLPNETVEIFDKNISYLITWSKTNRFWISDSNKFADFDGQYVTRKTSHKLNTIND
jgi:hypothetical protein